LKSVQASLTLPRLAFHNESLIDTLRGNTLDAMHLVSEKRDGGLDDLSFGLIRGARGSISNCQHSSFRTASDLQLLGF